MAIIDTERDVIVVRIVYDGPPLSGKTASVCALSKLLGRTAKIFSVEETPGDNQTLHFDWLEYTGGFFKGYSISCQIVSVPGQLSLAARHHLWRTADAVIFVLDANSENLENPLNYFKNLQQLGEKAGKNTTQAIIQANKQDKTPAATAAQIREILLQEYPQIRIVETEALTGKGIRETFVLAVRLAVERAATLMAKGQMHYGKPEINSGEEFISALQTAHFSLREETPKTAELKTDSAGLEASAGNSIGLEASAGNSIIGLEASAGNSIGLEALAGEARLPEPQAEITCSTTTTAVVAQEFQPSGESAGSSEIIPATTDIYVTKEETDAETDIMPVTTDTCSVTEAEITIDATAPLVTDNFQGTKGMVVVDKEAIPTIDDSQATEEEIGVETDTMTAGVTEAEIAIVATALSVTDNFQGTEEVVTIDRDTTLTTDNLQITKQETDIDTGIPPTQDNLYVMEAVSPPSDAITAKNRTPVIEENANQSMVTQKSLAKTVPTKHLPQFPDESTPTQWIWPPIHGRSILNRLLGRTLKPRLKHDRWWIIQAHNEWHCFSKVGWQYSEAVQARQALRTHIRLHLECSPILSEHRCVVVAIEGTNKAWRLWQIVPQEPTLAEHLAKSLRQETPAQVALEIFRCATRYVDALQQCWQYPPALNLNLDNVGVNAQSQLIYLGTIEDTPALEHHAWNEVALVTAIKQEFEARITKLLPQTGSKVAEILHELSSIDGFEHQYIVDALIAIFTELR